VVSRVRLPVVGGLVKVLAQPVSVTADITALAAAVNTLNAAVGVLQNPVVTPGSFSQPPTATVRVVATSGATNAFMDAGSAPAADPSILVQRGRRGEQGDDGRPGRPGVSGLSIVGLQGFPGR